MNMNKITVIGRLTRDVELKDFNGRNVASFGVASQNKRKDKDTGEYGSNFYTVSVWGASADVAARYLKKGNRVGVSGDLVYREYVGNDGKNHGILEINNAEIDLIETAAESGGSATVRSVSAPAPQASAPAQFTPVETDQLPF